MNCLHTAVNDFRPRRKHFSISGSLLLLLMPLLLLQLLVTQTSARPSDETAAININADGKHNNKNNNYADNAGDMMAVDELGGVDDAAFIADDEYDNVDNVEWHHVKIIDGVMHEDHPVIMYKEDFVSEDYDPNKASQPASDTNASKESHLKRLRYAINETEGDKYHALKPEKVYFDLPQTPIVVGDDASSTNVDTKFDPSKIRVEVISLLDSGDAAEAPSKQVLSKRPKKYLRRHHRRHRQQQQEQQQSDDQEQTAHNRQRRDVSPVEKTSENNAEVVRSKRTPHISTQSGYFYQQNLPEYSPKHSVAGKKWNGIDDSVPDVFSIAPRWRVDGEKVIWGVRRVNNRPATTTRKPMTELEAAFPPIFHIPEDGKNSLPNNNQQPDPIYTRPSTERPSRRPPSPQQASPPRISECTWAIVNCCTSPTNQLRYKCFENFNCVGAFWDLNPCADNVRDAAIDFIGNFED